jgi:hypothetical protein
MSVPKIGGSYIKHIKKHSEQEMRITLKNGEILVLRAIPTNFGYDARIDIKKYEEVYK